MRTILGILIVFSQISFIAQAQRVCGTSNYTQAIIAKNPALAKQYAIAEAQITAVTKTSFAASSRDTTKDEIIYVPVVMHVLYKTGDQNISMEQIQSQLKVLNEDYSHTNKDAINTPAVFASLAADTRIRFCLAQVDPQGRRTSGVLRKYTTADNFDLTDGVKNSTLGGDNPWDSKRYLNIWICNLSGRTLGYSSLPGAPAITDGVVISYSVFGTVGNLRAPFNKGRTATHEIGHWLGLKHIWGDAICGTDGVEDTPTQQYFNYGCPTFPHVGNCSPNANGDLFMNYMDFTDDGCMNLFTYGQKQRMRALFARNNMRNSFLLSYACDSTLAQGGALPDGVADSTAINLKPITINKAGYFSAIIYPNPATTLLSIDYKNGSIANKKSISIYSVSGYKIFTASLVAVKTTVNIATMANGIYIVSITDGNTTITSKFIKQ